MSKTENTPEAKTVSTYTREQICQSEKYKDSRDILSALLSDHKAYTLAEVDQVISEFKAKPVTEKVNGGRA